MRNNEKAILVATMKLVTGVTMIPNNDDKEGNKNSMITTITLIKLMTITTQ